MVAHRLMKSVEAATRIPQESAVLRFVRHLLKDFHAETFFPSITVTK
jgi:hypothetical protein